MTLSLDLSESFKIALSAIAANKSRGALTTLGIVIGIVAVITTMTAANGLQNTFKATFASVGTDVIYVSQRPWVQMGPDFSLNKRPPITLAVSEALTRKFQGRAVVNPSISGQQSAKFGTEEMDSVNVIGTTEKQLQVSSRVPANGRFLMPFDIRYKRRVAVIGWGVADSLFGRLDPVGRKLKVGRYDFTVIGVMEKEGGSNFFGGPDFDKQINIPISTFGSTFGTSGGRINVNVAIKTPANERPEDFEFEATGAMRGIRGLKPVEPDDFSINRQDQIVSTFRQVAGTIAAVGLFITGLSLFVGGIGIMNIMFVSVAERTTEIGIRKAIGARRRTILIQFLIEAAGICVLGGMIGLAIAWPVTLLMRQFMPATMSPTIVVLALLVAATTGLVAGFMPAWRAARMNPVDALRAE